MQGLTIEPPASLSAGYLAKGADVKTRKSPALFRASARLSRLNSPTNPATLAAYYPSIFRLTSAEQKYRVRLLIRRLGLFLFMQEQERVPISFDRRRAGKVTSPFVSAVSEAGCQILRLKRCTNEKDVLEGSFRADRADGIPGLGTA